nr:MAG TPA: hypothetical protein [Bacteriophage sp.]DAD57830.1 MAG TPA: hypothetical protein [Bacteriophage sp.]
MPKVYKYERLLILVILISVINNILKNIFYYWSVYG